MNVIEALFITLGLDTTDFEKKNAGVMASLKKMGEASDKQTKLIAESGKKAANAFSLLKIEVLGALAAFGVSDGFKDFIEKNVQGQAALGRTATNLGMSARTLRDWGAIAEEMGGKADDAYGALQNINKGLAEIRSGMPSSFRDAALNWGVKVDLKSPEQTLLNIADRLAGIKDRSQAMLMANQLQVGGYFNELMLGRQELIRRRNEADLYTGNIDSPDAQHLQYQAALIRLRLENIEDKVLVKLGPMLEKLANKFADWLDGIDWDAVIAACKKWVQKLLDLVDSIGGWKTVIEILGATMAARLLSPILALSAGLVGMTAKMARLGIAADGLYLLFGPAAAALAAIAAFHVEGLGGPKRADGTYADEPPLSMVKPPPSNLDLLSAAQGKPSTFKGNSETAALLLAHHAYPDMDEDGLHALAKEITSGKVDPFKILPAAMFAVPAVPAAPAAPIAPTAAIAPVAETAPIAETPYADVDAKYRLPKGFMYHVEAVESGHNAYAVSPKGAEGPFQFTPETAKSYGLNEIDVFNKQKAAEKAGEYIAYLRDKFGGLREAMAAYNWGPGHLSKDIQDNGANWAAHLPAETRAYLNSLNLSGTLARVSQPAPNIDRSVSVTVQHLDIHNPGNAKDVAQNVGKALRQNNLIMGLNSGLA